MPDEKWLWDRPHSWHAVNRSLLDIGVLLNHLNELPDSRLLVRRNSKFGPHKAVEVEDDSARRWVGSDAWQCRRLTVVVVVGADRR